MHTKLLRNLIMLVAFVAIGIGTASAALTKRPFVYGVKLEQNGSMAKVTYTRAAANTDVKALTVVLYCDGKEVARTAGPTGNQTSSVEFDLEGFRVPKGKITAEVIAEAHAADNTGGFVRALTGYKNPTSVAISPAEATLGMTYIADQDGLHYLGRNMEKYADTKYNDKGGIPGDNDETNKTNVVHRARFSQDGQLFIMSAPSVVKANMGLYKVPSLYNLSTAWTSPLTESGCTGTGLSVYGSGNSLKIAGIVNTTRANGGSGNNGLFIWNVTNNGTSGSVSNKAGAGGTKDIITGFLRPRHMHAAFDKDGAGFVIMGFSGGARDGDRSLHHGKFTSYSGFEIDKSYYKDADGVDAKLQFQNTSFYVYNNDYTLCAVGQNNKVVIYKVTWGESGKMPTLSDPLTITDATNLAVNGVDRLTDAAFDAANNLYVTNNNLNNLVLLRLPEGYGSDKFKATAKESFDFAGSTLSGVEEWAPYITQVKSFPGRNTVSVQWDVNIPEGTQLKWHDGKDLTPEQIAENEEYNKYMTKTYTLLRDGIVLVDHLDCTSFVDMLVPDGDHEYQVLAYSYSGIERKSPKRSLTEAIHRDYAITSYALDEIYNYPIMSPAEAEETSVGDEYFSTYVAGETDRHTFKYKAGTGGAPGDINRQAVLHVVDGVPYWYISQLTTRVSSDGTISIYGGETLSQTDNTKLGESGGILRVPANDPRKGLVKNFSYRSLSNQSLAMTEDHNPNFYFRAEGNELVYNQTTKKYGIPSGTRYLDAINNIGYKRSYTDGGTTMLGTGGFNFKTEADNIKDIQYYRTHYMAARGFVADGTGKLFFAQNMSRDAFIYDLDTDGTLKSYKKISAPEKNEKGEEYTAGTENYMLPIVGRPDQYIHVLRSTAVFHVDVSGPNPVYTPILTNQSDVRSASGITFTMRNSFAAGTSADNSTEVFFLHGTSTNSNNPGHFRIDMPQREVKGNAYTGLHTTADFTDMVPMATKLQKEIPGFKAGNSNGMWFGTQNVIEDGIEVVYIYQYVPGVRFAKYRFYPVQSFPPAQPTIEVKVRHDKNDDDVAKADDITHFDIAYSWQRPQNFDEIGTTNFSILEYDVELLDGRLNVIDSYKKPADKDEKKGTVYTGTYNYQVDPTNPQNLKEVDASRYTVRVTPVYVSKTDDSRTYIGETGVATDKDDYDVAIRRISAMAFHDPNAGIYRVDIDFDRAPRVASECLSGESPSPEPPTRFKLQVNKGDGKGWVDIDNLRMFREGKIFINGSNASETGHLPKLPRHDGYYAHDYDFGGKFLRAPGRGERPAYSPRRSVAARAGEALGDKAYTQDMLGGTVEEDALPAVGYHTTTEDPRSWRYRAIALYADKQPFTSIKKQAIVETGVTYVTIPTGVEDITDNASALHVWPVPADETIQVSSPEAIRTIEVFSLSGAKVISTEADGDTHATVAVGHLTPGVYMLRVNGDAPVRIIKK